jgi:L-2-hydroxyglutarate oxidase LhgO
VEGRKLAWEYCDRKGIPYKQVGKLIVATEESEIPRLMDLWDRGQKNGVEGLQLLDAAQIREREPYCRGIKAIFSPVTGIVDWGLVSKSYGDDAKERGAEMHLGAQVTGIKRHPKLMSLVIGEEGKSGEIQARYIITCAGLYSDKVAGFTGGKEDPKIVPFRGDYLVLKPEKSYLVQGNIYPVPDPEFPFLGVHFTPRMDGSIWLGPNAVLAFAREGYSFFSINAPELWETLTYPGFLKMATKYWKVGAGEMYRDLLRSAYVKALQRYIPELQSSDCLPGPSGVRAQAMNADGSLVDDFVFDGDANVVHVRNAPSPAATSSLAIGKYIADEAGKRFDLSKTSVLT